MKETYKVVPLLHFLTSGLWNNWKAQLSRIFGNTFTEYFCFSLWYNIEFFWTLGRYTLNTQLRQIKNSPSCRRWIPKHQLFLFTYVMEESKTLMGTSRLIDATFLDVWHVLNGCKALTQLWYLFIWEKEKSVYIR